MSFHHRVWFEEVLEEDLRWVFGVKKILDSSVSKFQDIELVESSPFGKVLLLDGKLQSAEFDEFIYHELLVHPSMLFHSNPKKVFILGGGEGSTAREVLKNNSVEKVVMCDIDEEVVNFCKNHWDVNKEAFADEKLHLVIDDAKAELIKTKETFDVIVGDLADPLDGGPCYQLYTKEFYEDVLKPRLNPGGIFVTQSGPGGVLSSHILFSPILNTLRQVFKYAKPYQCHIPSFADTWGWVMASDSPFPDLSSQEIDELVKNRIKESELRFLDGETLLSVCVINKHVKKIFKQEKRVFMKGDKPSVYGMGILKQKQMENDSDFLSSPSNANGTHCNGNCNC